MVTKQFGEKETKEDSAGTAVAGTAVTARGKKRPAVDPVIQLQMQQMKDQMDQMAQMVKMQAQFMNKMTGGSAVKTDHGDFYKRARFVADQTLSQSPQQPTTENEIPSSQCKPLTCSRRSICVCTSDTHSFRLYVAFDTVLLDILESRHGPLVVEQESDEQAAKKAGYPLTPIATPITLKEAIAASKKPINGDGIPQEYPLRDYQCTIPTEQKVNIDGELSKYSRQTLSSATVFRLHFMHPLG